MSHDAAAPPPDGSTTWQLLQRPGPARRAARRHWCVLPCLAGRPSLGPGLAPAQSHLPSGHLHSLLCLPAIQVGARVGVTILLRHEREHGVDYARVQGCGGLQRRASTHERTRLRSSAPVWRARRPSPWGQACAASSAGGRSHVKWDVRGRAPHSNRMMGRPERSWTKGALLCGLYVRCLRRQAHACGASSARWQGRHGSKAGT